MTETQTMNVPVPEDDGDDDEPEFRPRPRRRAHALTFVLAGALLIAAGFYGGVLLQKHEDHGSTSAATARGTAAARFAALAGGTGTGATGSTVAGGGAAGAGAGGTGAGGGGRAFGGFGGGAGGGAVTGTVKLVDLNNVYVTDTNGDVVKVETGASSQLTRTVPATTRDIAPGDVVIVRGSLNRDGSYTAQSVVVSPSAAG